MAKQTETNQILTVENLRLFKGAPISVLLAIAILNRPLRNDELEMLTGYTDKTIKRAVDWLSTLRYIYRTRSGWLIGERYQLPLMADRRISDSINTIESLSLNNMDDSIVITNRNYSENLAALKAAGIGEPKRTEIANAPDITPGKITGWQTVLLAEKKSRYSPGLLIYVLLNDPGDPPLNENGHVKNCDCEKCRYAKYTVPDYMNDDFEDDETDDFDE